MNYLAHLFLADEDPESIIGSLMGDFVKGRIDEDLPPAVRWGIFIHRKVDAYTDTHTVVRRSKHRLRSEYRRYSGILVDLYYDHFLALHWSRYSAAPLEDFAASVYQILCGYFEKLPARMQSSASYIMANDLLLSYREVDGIRRALKGIEGRLTRPIQLRQAVFDLEHNYRSLETDFLAFFPELIHFVEQLNAQNNQPLSRHP